MENTIFNAAVANNNTNTTDNTFAALDSFIAASKKQDSTDFEKLDAMRAKSREQAREKALHDTTYHVIVSSSKNGHFGACSFELDSQDAPVPQIRSNQLNNGTVMSNKIATLATAYSIVQSHVQNENTRKHVVLYMQDSEAQRVSGMLKRLKSGNDVALTDKELTWINNRNDMGSAYVAIATKLFGALSLAREKGITVRVVSNDSLDGYTLQSNRLPLYLDGKEVTFRNGTGRYQNNILTVKNFTLNGKHTLKNVGGRIVVERVLNKDVTPGDYYAHEIRGLVARAIRKAAEQEGTLDIMDGASLSA